MRVPSDKQTTRYTKGIPFCPHIMSADASPTGAVSGASTTSLAQTDPFSTPAPSRPPSIRSRPRTSASYTSTTTTTSTTSSNVHHRRPPSSASSPRGILRNSSNLTSTRPLSRQSIGAVAAAAAASLLPLPRPKAVQRMRSHMVPEGTEFPKPWLEAPNFRAKFSYYLVYFLIALGKF